MMKHLFLAITLLFPFSNFLLPTDFEAANLKANQLLNDLVGREDIVGASITIGLGDSIIHSKGYGLMDKDQVINTQPYTKFRIYSLSKHITAIAAAKLYEDGKLDLDKEIGNYIPFLGNHLKKITTRELIGHTSGIRSYKEGEWQIFANSVCSSPFEAIRAFESDTLLFEPGEKYSYTSFGYVLLSAVIEKVSGKRFLTYLNKDILEPIGIKNISLDNPDVTDYLRAKPYEYWKEVMYNARYANNTCKFGGGGLSASTLDIVLFNQALLNNKIVKKETVDLILTSIKLNSGEPTNYGFGLQFEKDKKGRLLAWHSGRGRGGRNALILYPEYGLVICVSANTNGDGIVNETEEIANLYLDVL